MSGGGPFDQAKNEFVLTIDNYGRTPATLVSYAVECCERSSIPGQPVYDQPGYAKNPHGGRFAPLVRALPLGRLKIPTNYCDPVVYGRFWYEDVWGEAHEYGFIQEISTGVAPQVAYNPRYAESD